MPTRPSARACWKLLCRQLRARSAKRVALRYAAKATSAPGAKLLELENETQVRARPPACAFHHQARPGRAHLTIKESEKMQCSEIMTKNPECCLPSDSVITAAQLMK